MDLATIKSHITEQAADCSLYAGFVEKMDSLKQWDDLDATCAVYGIFDTDDLDEFLQVNAWFADTDITAEQTAATRYEWRVGGKSFSQYCKKYQRVSRRLYWYFLEILPPMYKPDGFLVSEPYSYDPDAGQNTYSAFYTLVGNYYWLGDIAPKKYNAVVIELLEQLQA